MNIKMYVQNEKWIAGMTMKDMTEPEHFNMALHACQNENAVLQNRQQLANFLNCELDDFVCAEQTHSANFYQVIHPDKGRGADKLETAIPATDALYTYEPNLLLCSFHADCVPVFFYHEVRGVVGVIHSGWQGTVKEISLKLFEHLIQVEQCDPKDFHVQICPALSQRKFEVDEDVFVQYKALGYADKWIEYRHQTGKYHIDNQQTVKEQCLLAGIPEDCIHIDTTCTFQSPAGFSYRQDKQSGRHLCFIMKK
ncbi:peptidoglycan editing factor PgeF [Lederbergia galactosidilytica]|uniref:Purine nucleoside phosphorylase n=1 Tax=Lederbergia galactosidilytica TaxID=217031 RepID=A0A177ZHI0_9BACI|nr:peptidoglycan editing factor PgeF [Lederbergia galactosidilytica]OAK67275.1 Laccase domain protein [Lederbergia galactosidilytica]